MCDIVLYVTDSSLPRYDHLQASFFQVLSPFLFFILFLFPFSLSSFCFLLHSSLYFSTMFTPSILFSLVTGLQLWQSHGVSDSASKVVEVSAINEMGEKEGRVQPVDTANYVSQEVYLGIEQVVDPNCSLGVVQKKHCRELVESMGLQGLECCMEYCLFSTVHRRTLLLLQMIRLCRKLVVEMWSKGCPLVILDYIISVEWCVS